MQLQNINKKKVIFSLEITQNNCSKLSLGFRKIYKFQI